MNEINFIKTPLPQEPSVSPSNKIDVTEKPQESFENVISPYHSPFEVFKKGQSKQASSQALNSDKEDSQVKKTLYDRLEEARKNDKKLPPAIYAIEMKDYELLKFIIDMGEDLEKRMPDIPVYERYSNEWNGSGWTKFHGYQPGLKPLEYALKKNDVEAVRCLLEHNPANKSDVNTLRTEYISSWLTPYSGDHGPGLVSEGMETRTESLWDAANRQKCDPEILYLILTHSPQLNLAVIAENFRQKGNSEYFSSALRALYQVWKGEDLIVSQESLKKMMQTSFDEALKAKDKETISLYVESGWAISSSSISLVVENSELLNQLLKGNISSIKALEALVENKAGLELIENAVSNLSDPTAAFSIASRFDYVELVKILIAKDILPNLSDYKDALKASRDEIAILIIATLVNENKLDQPDDWLKAAVREGRFEVVFELLSRGLFSEEGRKEAQQIAYKLANYEILDLLIHYPA